MPTTYPSLPTRQLKPWVQQCLDALLNGLPPIALGSYRYHPYFLMTDLGRLSSLGIAYAYLRTSTALPFLTFLWVFVAVLTLYNVVRQTIKTHFGITARSYLQDTVLIILPTYYGLIRYVAQADVAQAWAVFALVAPFYLFFARLGCFFGGCCYGIASSWGVHYAASHGQSVNGCRRFKAAPCPSERVLPTQLVEALCSLLIGLGLAHLLLTHQLEASQALYVYFLLYCPVRFLIDFFRRSSARPRYGRYSEAQLCCLLLFSLALVGIAYHQGAFF